MGHQRHAIGILLLALLWTTEGAAALQSAAVQQPPAEKTHAIPGKETRLSDALNAPGVSQEYPYYPGPTAARFFLRQSSQPWMAGAAFLWWRPRTRPT